MNCPHFLKLRFFQIKPQADRKYNKSFYDSTHGCSLHYEKRMETHILFHNGGNKRDLLGLFCPNHLLDHLIIFPQGFLRLMS